MSPYLSKPIRSEREYAFELLDSEREPTDVEKQFLFSSTRYVLKKALDQFGLNMSHIGA